MSGKPSMATDEACANGELSVGRLISRRTTCGSSTTTITITAIRAAPDQEFFKFNQHRHQRHLRPLLPKEACPSSPPLRGLGRLMSVTIVQLSARIYNLH